jgi:hypothetical protein
MTYVLKLETPEAVPLSLDEAIAKAIELQDTAREEKKILDNVKKVIKDHLAAKGVETYETPEGHKAGFSTSQRPKYDKELIKEATGELFELCVTYSTVKSFKVS